MSPKRNELMVVVQGAVRGVGKARERDGASEIPFILSQLVPLIFRLSLIFSVFALRTLKSTAYEN